MATPIRLDGITVKVESSYGSDPTPAVGDDGVRVSDRVWSSISHDFAFPNDRPNAATGTLLPVAPAKPKGRMASLEIVTEITGPGAAYSATVKPEVHTLLLACGMSSTLVTSSGSEKYTYTFADSSHSSCTIWAYAGGLLFKVVGCRGTVRIPMDAGSIGTMVFSMQGLMVTDPATTGLSTIAYDASLPAVATGMSVTVGSWAPDILSAEYATNSAVSMVADGNATDGINSFEIGGFAPTMSISSKSFPVTGTHGASIYDPYSDMQDRTNRAILITVGDTQYYRMKLSVGTAHVASIDHVNQDEFTGWDLTYNCYSGDIIFD